MALEVIATSVADALAAEAGGASRIELVTALERGGLTPPVELVDAVLRAVRIPVRVMVRETEAHEVADTASRRRLAACARDIGARPVDGIVFGAVARGGIDMALLDRVAEAAGRSVTFHRAFEAVEAPDAALDLLAAHPAVDLVLCDGGEGEWPARAERLQRWTRRAGGALRVMPGGGVTEGAIEVLAGTPDLVDLHVGRLVRSPETVEGQVSSAKVAALVARIASIRIP